MAETAALLAKMRSELGDFGQSFRDVITGTGELDEYDLSEVNATVTKVSVLEDGVLRDLVANTEYTVDSRHGRITFLGALGPLPLNTAAIVEGSAPGMFTDAELTEYLRDAELQHCHNRSVTVRYRSTKNGFIRYEETPLGRDNLPEIEELPLAILGVIQALWALATDAASDTDINTPEGTRVDRGQRYTQILHQISVLQDRYDELCSMLQIGLNRIEMATLRRVSRTTNRLVPIFVSREYDDNGYPNRILPPVDKGDHEDASGLPNQIYGGWPG